MIVGKIIGKTNTIEFSFMVTGKINKFDYVQVIDDNSNYNLCQIVELERSKDRTIAQCRIIGHRDSEKRIVGIRIPFKPGIEVLKATDEFIKDILDIGMAKEGAFIGHLETKNIPIYIDLNTMLSRHIAILAKSGYGKSYAAGVFVEEILERKIPVVIIDPHGEYGSMKYENTNRDDISKLNSMSLHQKGYPSVFEYVLTEEQKKIISGDTILLRLPDNFTIEEINSLFSKKLSNTQIALLYDAFKRVDKPTLDNIIYAIDLDENPVKYTLLPVLEHVRKTGLFSSSFIPLNELVKEGNCTILNLKGIEPMLQELVVYKLTNMLFNMRKKNSIPPFFFLIEEAHNFIPERSFGEKLSSKIIRIVAAEGRKFGLSLGVISQRPARIDKSVLSQCTTNLILRITNPGDIKAVVHSFEGITGDIEKEISILPIGSAIMTGFFESPIFIKIRPRKTKHGGTSVNLIAQETNKISDKSEKVLSKSFSEAKDGYKENPKISVIFPMVKKSDVLLMSKNNNKDQKVLTILIPALLTKIKSTDGISHCVLFERVKGDIILDIDQKKTISGDSVKKATNLKNLETFYELSSIDFENLKPDKKLAPKITKNTIINQIGNAANVKSATECYIVNYIVK